MLDFYSGEAKGVPVTIRAEKLISALCKHSNQYVGPYSIHRKEKSITNAKSRIDHGDKIWNPVLEHPFYRTKGTSSAPEFIDGRHRFVALVESGYTEIEIVVPEGQVDDFKRLFN